MDHTTLFVRLFEAIAAIRSNSQPEWIAQEACRIIKIAADHGYAPPLPKSGQPSSAPFTTMISTVENPDAYPNWVYDIDQNSLRDSIL